MKNFTVKKLLLPISEYATVSLGTTLFDAILALEQAQEKFYHGKYQHRAILVLDDEKKVVGRISQHRILKAIEAGEELSKDLSKLKMFNFSDAYIENIRETIRLDTKIFTQQALKKAAGKKVEEFMQKPTPDEYVAESSPLDIAVHKLVSGNHLSLLVKRDEEIIGVLRIADVFVAACHGMKALNIGEK
ncbi:CBS domain-containing protein [Desulfocapsa sulfexigens DSM 10523]|uniref:CBS domain-containing protein n=1 Tax=Desulfocapsa sulfexigens (strain DSM 10523 / SB164P1) TaxID=1167006 RepID=M1NGJ7_DESSD|nr:CBS domain-containing protein [Desulfocapsa sulfexigens]AGF78769.1 CBS domain-containing protein [Desulfocapsa sulfexigens DSM 10523]